MTFSLTPTTLQIVELYEINTKIGVNIYLTNHDQNITVGSITYQGFGMAIMRDTINYHMDLQVDKLSISIGINGLTVGTQNYTIPKIIKAGFLRDAHVIVSALDLLQVGMTPVPIFEGNITGDIGYDAGILKLDVGSILDRFSDTFPKILYSANCNHQLYNQYCGITKASFKESNSVSSSVDNYTIYSAIFAFANRTSGWWVQGEIKFTSGANLNISKSISIHGDGYIKTRTPFPFLIEVGNTIDAWAGCDKSYTTCVTKFNNAVNFLGFPFIPKPELLYL